MLIILSRPPRFYFKGFLKYFIKKLARTVLRKKRGADAVLESLTRELKNKNISFKINKIPSRNDTVHVISNVEALRWAIQEKRKGLIKKIIAGPNLVIIPTEENSILDNELVETILVPGQWTRDLYRKYLPKNEGKIVAWPAGITPQDEISLSEKKGHEECLLYVKKAPDLIVKHISNELSKKGIHFSLIKYGNYSKKYYFKKLQEVKYLIYLQEFESQGIALQEAWAYNVPTLVWDRGYWQSGDYRFDAPQISCPYLTNETGITFKDTNDFPEKLSAFLENLENFTPRNYVERELSDEVSVRKYLAIIGE